MNRSVLTLAALVFSSVQFCYLYAATSLESQFSLIEDCCTLGIPPVVLDPPPAILEFECAEDVPPHSYLTAIDNCGNEITVYSIGEITETGECPNRFSIKIRRWTFTDNCGNTTVFEQEVHVDDHTPPVVVAPPADLTLQCGDAIPSMDDITAVDNCGGDINVSYTMDGNLNDCSSDLIRQWVFIDLCGNSTIVSQTITFHDDGPEADTCLLDAGSDLEILTGDIVELEATANNVANYSWGTYGDGEFANKKSLITSYTPGEGDIAKAEVILFIANGLPEMPAIEEVDHYTVKSGTWEDPAVWNSGIAPSQDIEGKHILLRHDITIKHGGIRMDLGAKLYADNINFKMYPNRSFFIMDAEVVFAGGSFVQYKNKNGNIIDVNFTQGDFLLEKPESKLTMVGTSVFVNGNFHNNGTRILKNVGLKVDRHFHNSGIDSLINVCGEIANAHINFGPAPISVHNKPSAQVMYVENTALHSFNGSLVNNSLLTGRFRALKVEEGSLMNTGTWNADIGEYCVDHFVDGNYNVHIPIEDCLAALDDLYDCNWNECISAYDEIRVLIDTTSEDSSDVEIHIPVVIFGGGDGDGPPKPPKPGGDGPGIYTSPRFGGFSGHPEMQLFPNPVGLNGRLNIHSNLKENATIRIMGVNGTIYYQDAYLGNLSIDLSELALQRGIYLVEIQDQLEFQHSKFLILD